MCVYEGEREKEEEERKKEGQREQVRGGKGVLRSNTVLNFLPYTTQWDGVALTELRYDQGGV